MKIKCLLGLHKWNIITRIIESQIKSNIKFDIENQNLPKLTCLGACTVIRPCDKYYNKKICTICKKIIDEITPAYKEIKQKTIKEMRLKKYYENKIRKN